MVATLVSLEVILHSLKDSKDNYGTSQVLIRGSSLEPNPVVTPDSPIQGALIKDMLSMGVPQVTLNR